MEKTVVKSRTRAAWANTGSFNKRSGICAGDGRKSSTSPPSLAREHRRYPHDGPPRRAYPQVRFPLHWRLPTARRPAAEPAFRRRYSMEPKSATAAASIPASTDETNELTGPVVVAVDVEDEE
ncbi:hypothetical protein GCM10010392_65000 [Streptomyces clavifer]|nr:hypothetical protein GCM10010392_65000 [Streptomyces clavifer]